MPTSLAARRPETADQPEERIPADIIVVAIGQGVEIAGFEQTGIPIRRGTFMAESSSQIDNMETVFAGGDCVTGPATAIRAIAAGKVAAANIDEQLGFHHEIRTDVEIPAPHLDVCPPRGRVNTKEREAAQRKCDFEDIECRHDARRSLRRERTLPALRSLRLRHLQRREDGKMVTLVIDNKTVCVPEGTSILDAARTASIDIPTLCYLKDLNEIGACRICMVEIEGQDTLGCRVRQ